MANSNLKDGLFSKKELGLYECLGNKDIEIILDYQKKLPILQEDNEKWINTRQLHNELGVSKAYSTWIKSMIEQLDLEQDEDFNINLVKTNDSFKGNVNDLNKNQLSRYGILEDYIMKVETAKEIAMISGVSNRANKELKENSKLARKYFILIEKAFKERIQWNSERADTIEMCKELKRPVYKMRDELEKYLPFWFKGNAYSFEFNLLNTIIIGKSATKYRIEKGLKINYPIRNTFDKHTLDIVHKLEQYDAILLEIQNMLNWEDRKPLLSAYYCSIRKN